MPDKAADQMAKKRKVIEVPLVGDFHYIGHKLLADYPDSPITVFGLRSGLRARSDMLARLVNPSELTCFLGIAKDGFQVRLSKHFGVL